MARRRGLSDEEIQKIEEVGAVGEAFGYYFNKQGDIVYATSSIGARIDDISNIETRIAVSGGKNKAEAIISTEINNNNSVLITDEGAAREILSIIK